MLKGWSFCLLQEKGCFGITDRVNCLSRVFQSNLERWPRQ